MLHFLVFTSTALFVSFALFGSLYVTAFAILGVRKRLDFSPAAPNARFLVLIPAHNESVGIEATIRSIQHANYPQNLVRTIVIADNCTDDTAERARECGAEVWIRNDLCNRGKGQALSWAFERVDDAFDLAPIIDADTELDPDYFAGMNSAYAAFLHNSHSEIILQSHCLFAKSSRSSSWFEHFMIASKAADNSLICKPRTILALANLIHGTGFCISRSALSKVPFGATSIVEDAEYAVMLALNGIPVAHVENARVFSRVCRRVKDAVGQRLRWASGTLDLLLHSIPVLLRKAIQLRRWRLAEMSVMLVFTSRLILVYVSAIALTLLWWTRSLPQFAIFRFAFAASVFLQALYLYLVLRRADNEPVPFIAITFMPFYFGFLGMMQLGAVLGLRKKQWTRATR